MSPPDLVRESPDGAVLSVRAAPGSARERVAGLHGGELKVAVHAPPEKGRANDAIVRVLARALGVPRSTVRVVSGSTTRGKRVLFEGLRAEELRARVGQLLEAR